MELTCRDWDRIALNTVESTHYKDNNGTAEVSVLSECLH